MGLNKIKIINITINAKNKVKTAIIYIKPPLSFLILILNLVDCEKIRSELGYTKNKN